MISAVLQDALISVKDLTYRPRRSAASRWSPTASAGKASRQCPDGGAAASGLRARVVRAVVRRRQRRLLSRLPPARRRADPVAAGDPAGRWRPATIDLEFAGGATVRLGVRRSGCTRPISARLGPPPGSPTTARTIRHEARTAATDDKLIMALPNGRILDRGDAAPAPRRHRAGAGLRRSRRRGSCALRPPIPGSTSSACAASTSRPLSPSARRRSASPATTC